MNIEDRLEHIKASLIEFQGQSIELIKFLESHFNVVDRKEAKNIYDVLLEDGFIIDAVKTQQSERVKGEIVFTQLKVKVLGD